MAGRIEQKHKEHAYKKFGEDLKNNDFSSVLFLYGIEQYLTEWATASLVKKYVNPGAFAFDFVKIDDENAEVSAIVEACDTFPMFSEKRVVWVKNHALLKSANPKGFTASDKEKLLSYAANPNEGTILIFSCEQAEDKSEVVKGLKKTVQCYNFDKLDYAQLAAFAEKRFRGAGVQIKRDLLRYLIDETGYFNKETEYRIFNLENDIKKIIDHSDGQQICREDISETLNGDMDTFVFNFLDAAANKKKEAAFLLMHNILNAGSDVFAVTGLLVSQFELILEVKEFKEDGAASTEIVKIMKIHEFRVKKAMTLADKFTKQKLKEILCRLYEIDRNVKTGLLEPKMALELLVGRI